MIEVYIYNKEYLRLYFCENDSISYHEKYKKDYYVFYPPKNCYLIDTDRYHRLLKWYDYVRSRRRTIRIVINEVEIKNPDKDQFEKYLFLMLFKSST